MGKLTVFALLPVLFMGACKTSGSKAKDFSINGDPAAAPQLIVDTVIKYYPDIAGQTGPIDQFATALADGHTDQAQSSDLVLQQAYAKMSSQDQDSANDFESYVVVEFTALTNYTTVKATPGTQLQYTGTTKS